MYIEAEYTVEFNVPLDTIITNHYIQCVLKVHLKACKFERDPCVSMNSAKESGIQFLPLDLRLFFSFYSPSLHFSISHIQTALQQICSWMTADLLTLNSSKTEFLLIRLKQHLAKTQNSPLNTTHSPCNLASSLMNTAHYPVMH